MHTSVCCDDAAERAKLAVRLNTQSNCATHTVRLLRKPPLTQARPRFSYHSYLRRVRELQGNHMPLQSCHGR